MNTIIKEVMSLPLLQVAGGNPTFLKVKEVTECKLLKCEWVNMQTGQDAELEAKKYGKWLKNWGAKYASKHSTLHFILNACCILQISR
jgi:hypothetical protein